MLLRRRHSRKSECRIPSSQLLGFRMESVSVKKISTVLLWKKVGIAHWTFILARLLGLLFIKPSQIAWERMNQKIASSIADHLMTKSKLGLTRLTRKKFSLAPRPVMLIFSTKSIKFYQHHCREVKRHAWMCQQPQRPNSSALSRASNPA